MNDWIDAEQRIERAQQFCDSRQWPEALEQIDKALEINPHNGAWWGTRALLLDHLSRHEEAIEAYTAALEQAPDDRELLVGLALDYIRTGQLLNALNAFDRLERVDPNYEPAYCHRIMLYSELGEHDQAEEMFYLAQQLDDTCPHCFWHMGCSVWARGDLRRAVWCWQRVLEIEPNYRFARKRIAEAYRRLGDFDRARENYLAEYRRDPGNIEILIELGVLHIEQGRHQEAITKFEQVLELDPSHARALELIGDACCLAGRREEGIAAYSQAAELDLSLPGVRYKLGARLMELGRFAEAKPNFDSELELQPMDRDCLMAAGNCALELGRPDEAQRCFENLIAVDDCLPGAYHNLGVCHFLRQEYEEGIRHCQAALQLKDDYVLARHKLVLANIQLRRWRDARSLLAESLAISPRHPVLLELKRKWPYTRLAAWATDLAASVTKLVRPGDS